MSAKTFNLGHQGGLGRAENHGPSETDPPNLRDQPAHTDGERTRQVGRGDADLGHRDHASLLQELLQEAPETADRLAQALAAFPQPGSEFLGFHLVRELGRGAFARVYLARQSGLANRPVALKVSVDLWGEAQMLAQLQHTNVVPLYSVHHASPFQLVCMPYLGAGTLEDVIAAIFKSGKPPQTGDALFAPEQPTAADGVALAPVDLVVSPTSSMRERLRQMKWVDAVLWLGARLCDGLAHAHEHGILHRDLKPANVLLADHGQPMLLDFNVAEDVKLRSWVTANLIGGTLPYMAPEHLAAFEHLPVAPLDGRCDVYSLGVILFELLTGIYPFTTFEASTPALLEHAVADRLAPPPPLRCWNPAITPAIESIVQKCLQPDLDRRYPGARQLQEDLERQLNHLPLRHAPDPSLGERLSKWSRRHPRLSSSTTVALLALLLLIGLGSLFFQAARDRANLQSRASALEELQHFVDDHKKVQFLLYTRLAEPDQMREGVSHSGSALARYRVLDDPHWQQAALVQALPESERASLRDLVAELLLLRARALSILEADQLLPDRRLEEASQLLDLAEAASPRAAASPTLWRQRARLCTLRGQAEEADRCRRQAEALPLASASDHYSAASDLIAQGRLREALPLLQQAVKWEPNNFWAHFILANCYDRFGQDARAEASYSVCIALAPTPWAYFNRGLALLRQQNYRQAQSDFDEALRLQPDLADALVNRALACQGLGDYRGALEDLTAALQRGSAETRIYFLRSRVRDKLKDAEGARRDLDEGMRRQPADEKSWLARGFARLTRDPRGALSDFDRALELNPRSLQALQNRAHVLSEKLQRPDDSLQTLNRAIELYPDAAALRSGRGVLLARLNRRAAAHLDAEEALLRDSSPPRLYQVGCIFALTSRLQTEDRLRAHQLLSSALRRGYGFELIDHDTDLDPIRQQPEFRRLVEAARALRAAKTPVPLSNP